MGKILMMATGRLMLILGTAAAWVVYLAGYQISHAPALNRARVMSWEQQHEAAVQREVQDESERAAAIIAERKEAGKVVVEEAKRRLAAGEDPTAVRAWVEQRQREMADETGRRLDAR